MGINPPTAQHEQARYLHAAIRTLLRSGARRVFVTLRDLDGQWGIFTSEGVLNWPVPTVKKSYYTVRGMSAGSSGAPRANADFAAPPGHVRAAVARSTGRGSARRLLVRFTLKQ